MSAAQFSSAPILAGVAIASALASASMFSHPPALLWNTTASAPLGFYRLAAFDSLEVGDWVAVRPSSPHQSWLAANSYLPTNVPLLKQVAAVAGQRVCRFGDTVTIDGRFAARALARGRGGVLLPVWRGCRQLGAGEIFLLNPARGSLDGRYLGVSRSSDVLGRARPLLTWDGQA